MLRKYKEVYRQCVLGLMLLCGLSFHAMAYQPGQNLSFCQCGSNPDNEGYAYLCLSTTPANCANLSNFDATCLPIPCDSSNDGQTIAVALTSQDKDALRQLLG